MIVLPKGHKKGIEMQALSFFLFFNRKGSLTSFGSSEISVILEHNVTLIKITGEFRIH